MSRVVYAVQFKQRDTEIRLHQSDAERAFRDLFGTQSEQTNLPDDFDPNAPRIIFQSNHKSLVITQLGCQFSLQFEKSDIAGKDQFAIIEKNVTEFHRKLCTFKAANTLGEMAFVLLINYPSRASKQKMHDYISSHFLKVESIGPVASVAFNIGYKIDDKIFLNLEVNVYEMRKATFTPPMIVSGSTAIDVTKIPIVEEGFGVKLDVNDRPSASKSESDENQGPSEIIKASYAFAQQRLESFMGFKLEN